MARESESSKKEDSSSRKETQAPKATSVPETGRVSAGAGVGAAASGVKTSGRESGGTGNGLKEQRVAASDNGRSSDGNGGGGSSYGTRDPLSMYYEPSKSGGIAAASQYVSGAAPLQADLERMDRAGYRNPGMSTQTTNGWYDPPGSEFVSFDQFRQNIGNGSMGSTRSADYGKTVEDSGSQKSLFENLYDFLQAPAEARSAEEYQKQALLNGLYDAHGGSRIRASANMAGGPGRSMGLSSHSVDTVPVDHEGNPIIRPNDPGMTWQEARRGLLTPPVQVAERLTPDPTTSAYVDPHASSALGGIDAAMVGLPRRDPRGYAANSDVFATDGQVLDTGGNIVRPGSDSSRRPVEITVPVGGESSKDEPSTFDKIVDGAGTILSHTGLGSIVSSLFPDMWNGMGDAVKGIGSGVRGTATSDGDHTHWDPTVGGWVDGGASSTGNGGDYYGGDYYGGTSPGYGMQMFADFLDVNGNGVDDRMEAIGVAPPAAAAAPGGSSGRTARFPQMPPYNPGRDDEWSYFANNHLADGGPVYAEGGAIDHSDPRVKLIGDTEEVLARIKDGEKPDEAAATTLKAFVAQFGDAALKSLHDNVSGGMTMKGGRLISGPGGPKDDAVPAVIVDEGSVKSPAKLSNGEFVFSVDAVNGAGGPEALQELADRLTKKAAA